MEDKEEVPKLSKERVKEIEEGVNWYKGNHHDQSQGSEHYLYMIDRIKELEKENEQLKYWKESEIKVWSEVLDYMHKRKDLKLGASISDYVLKFLKERDELKDKEIRGDRMIVDLELAKTVLKSENEQLKEALGWALSEAGPFHDDLSCDLYDKYRKLLGK
jgi:hypothetical protein